MMSAEIAQLRAIVAAMPPAAEGMGPYLAKVRDGAYTVTDGDVEQLKADGFSEDEIPLLAEKAAADSQSIGNPRDVDAKNYERIYARAFEAGRHRKVARTLAHASS